MIVELIGIPGCGKSYISNQYAKKYNMIDFTKKLFSAFGNLKFKLFVHLRLSYAFEKKNHKKNYVIS